MFSLSGRTPRPTDATADRGHRVETPGAHREDITTGGSVLQAVESVREAGGQIVGVAVIVDRDTGARERIEAEGLPYRAAMSLADLGLA